MTTLENAARQALEKMEYMMAHGEWYAPEQAIEALRQALDQRKQEPVAWMYDWESDGGTVTNWLTSDYDEAHSPTMGCTNIRPLYTKPPKREWVGLTDDEMAEVANKAETYTESVKLTEAALNEKNT